MIQSTTIQITPEILGLVASIDEFKGAWRALGTLAPDRLSALLRVATIESIGSSARIEGSRLSDRDVERLLSKLQIQKFSTRDEQEVAGYAKVMEMVFTSWQDIALTENHIKQLHRDLLIHSETDAWHRGNYKASTNSVVAFDEDPITLGGVKEGTIAGTVVQDPYEWGYQGMKLVAKVLEKDMSGIPENKLVIVPTKIIDKSNVDAFEAELKSRIGG